MSGRRRITLTLKLLASVDDTGGTQAFKKELVKGWLDETTHPLNVFNKLKLNEAGDDLLSNSLLSVWVQYMKFFNEKFPHAETTMIQTFTKSYKGDEVKLAQMLEAAKKVPSTEKIATNPDADFAFQP
ncbi:hypothetical protein V7S43_011162 [Phytophthora oleae]|uniref:RxLR effector PexRD54 WY domain-containing protein n=1 Tax=Phytophthora oleae TaxID=2107226 RepID=A0ABD3FBC5_9STRA